MLFDRVYRLLVGKKGSKTGLEITELKIEFDITKNAKKNPNSGSIKIWNLKKETRAEMEKPDTRCLLYAGYKEDSGPLLIFSGSVTFAWTKFEKADVITEFELGDGTKEIRDTTISVGYGKGVKTKQVLKDVSKKMDLPLQMPSNLVERTWENGLSYFGSALGLMDKATKASNMEWSIQNGNVQVIEKGMVTTRNGILISPTSGLIGSPERRRASKGESSKKEGGKNKGSATTTKTTKPSEVSLPTPPIPPKLRSVDDSEGDDDPRENGKDKNLKEESETDKQTDGWNIKTLLMPTLNPGDRVKLESKTVTGVFRIEEIKHTGSSHDGDWQSEMQLVDSAKPIAEKKEAKKTKGGVAKRSGKKSAAKDNDEIYRFVG